ncbi:MAG TPA: class I SAM-dependent methyltransferase [Methanosarcinaceae archaeon]|nr:class I SAM-dependent methyltransferase [Methanosarcinaceae archaeon]
MNDTKNKIKEYWNERSSTFDLSPGHVIINRNEGAAWKSLLQEKIGLNAKKVIDIGAGTGFLSIMLAEMGYEVVGLDLSEEMMERAKKKAMVRGVKVEFKQGDAENLPFETGSFDALVNRAVLWTLPNPKKAIAEWRRVLKPGGKLCFFLHEPHPDGVSDRARRYFGNIFILVTERRNPWNSLYDGNKLGVDLPFRGGVEPSVITKLLEDSGLKNVSAEPMMKIARLKRNNLPLFNKITASKHVQYCYTAVNPK